MGNLRIDTDKCIGCGKCVRMCLANNLEVKDRKVRELGAGCIKCGHCVSSCPKGAIELIGGTEGETSLKNKGMLDGRLISDEDLETLYSAMRGGFAGKRCWFATLQGEQLDRYVEDSMDILKKGASDMPIVGDWEKWREKHDVLEPNPVQWEGKQVLFIFADGPDQAFEASNRMIVRGFPMGIRGFHSNALMMAHKLEPTMLDAYFPGAVGKMYMAFVIGHGRRLVEPLFKPIEKMKSIFR